MNRFYRPALLALGLSFAVAACGGKKDSPETPKDPGAVTATEKPSGEADPTREAATDKPKTAETAPADPKPADPAPKAEAGSADAAAYPALGEPAKLRLLGAAAAGGAPLRWKPAADASAKLTMTMDTDMDIKVQGQAMPMKMSMKMDMDGAVKEVLGDGNAVIAMVVQDASLDMPGMGAAGAGDAIKNMLKGLTITTTMDARGNVKDTKVSGGGAMMAQLGEQMNDSLDQMAIPFPEEAVAVGSKWEALTTQKANGMTVRMRAVYELIELDGDKGKVKLSITQDADPQKMDMNGVKADLQKLNSSGGGEMSFDLTRPMFTEAKMKIDMDATMKLMGQTATMKVGAAVSMAPRG